ncbi:hypothetical protein V3C99_000636, partial [Haemonchus contortus]
DCLEPWKPPLPNIAYEPVFAPFLEMSGGLMKLIARSSDEKSIEVMIESIAQKSTTWSTVLQLFMHNIVSILIFVSGFLLALTVLLGCVCMCIFRSPTASREKPKSGIIWCSWFMFVFCTIMSIICIVLVGSAAHSITVGLNALPDQVNKSVTDVESFVEQLAQQFQCQFEYHINNISDYIETIANESKEEADLLDKTLSDLEEARANLQPQSLKQSLIILMESGNVDSTKIKALIGLVDDAMNPPTKIFDEEQLKKGLLEFKKAVEVFGNQRSAIQTILHSVIDDTVLTVFNRIVDFVADSSHMITTFSENHDKFSSHTNYIFYLCIIIPSLMLFLCTFCMALLLFSSKSRLMWWFGGEVMGATGYAAMILTAFLFIISSFAFLTACSAAMVCISSFEDNNLRVFRLTDHLFIPENTLHIRVSEILFKCRNGYSFFDAMNGSQLLDETAIERRINLLNVRDEASTIERAAYNINATSAYDTFLADGNALFREATSKKDIVQKLKEEAESSLRAFQARVQDIVDYLKKMAAIIQQLSPLAFEKEAKTINQYVTDSVKNLVSYGADMSPRCGQLMSIWNNIGWYACKFIAQPLSGIWVACVITAIASLIIHQSLFDTAKYLRSVHRYRRYIEARTFRGPLNFNRNDTNRIKEGNSRRLGKFSYR